MKGLDLLGKENIYADPVECLLGGVSRYILQFVETNRGIVTINVINGQFYC